MHHVLTESILEQSLLSNYHNLVKKIDNFCQAMEKRYPESLACQKGCSSCCRHISLFPVEALALSMALDTLPPETREKIRRRAQDTDADGPCPLLEDGACLMYHHRPIICQTHGLPILVTAESGTCLDHCPLNFTTGEPPEKAFSLDLEQLNTLLSAVNNLFLEEAFPEESLPQRILLSEALLMECQVTCA